jgi:hypothetical protein
MPFALHGGSFTPPSHRAMEGVQVVARTGSHPVGGAILVSVLFRCPIDLPGRASPDFLPALTTNPCGRGACAPLARRGARSSRAGRTQCMHTDVAQLEERWFWEPGVAGSSPAIRTDFACASYEAIFCGCGAGADRRS